MLEITWTIVQPDDYFFFTIYANSRKAEMSSWGWTKEEQRDFLLMQHQCQQRSYQMQYSNLESRIIFFENTPAGRHIFNWKQRGP